MTLQKYKTFLNCQEAFAKNFLFLQKIYSYGTDFIVIRIVNRYFCRGFSRIDRSKTQNRIRLGILHFDFVYSACRFYCLPVVRATAAWQPQLGLPRKHTGNSYNILSAAIPLSFTSVSELNYPIV